VDGEIARIAEGATRIFRSLGAKVESACCDFSEVNDIVLGTRGLSMVANHADKLPQWKDQMQNGLVWNIEQGLKLSPEEIGRPALPRRAALPDAHQRQAPRQLHPVVLPDLRHHRHRPARPLGAVRLHQERPAGGASDRRAAAAGGDGAARGGGLRSRGALGGQDPGDRGPAIGVRS
jgi:hypothetical protein